MGGRVEAQPNLEVGIESLAEATIGAGNGVKAEQVAEPEPVLESVPEPEPEQELEPEQEQELEQEQQEQQEPKSDPEPEPLSAQSLSAPADDDYDDDDSDGSLGDLDELEEFLTKIS